MLKKRCSSYLAAMSLRPSASSSSSSSYRGGGRNQCQWRTPTTSRRGFSNRPITDTDDNTPPLPPQQQPPRFHAPPYFSNPYHHHHHQFAPPHPHPLYKPNQRFPPNQRQPQPPFPLPSPFRRPSNPKPPSSSDYRIWEHAKPPLPPPTSERFTVLSYNILADYLAINHRSKLYFHIPPHLLSWPFRFRSILFELGLWSPDILCLQEVDRFQDLQQHLKPRGYIGIWKMRTGDPVDGCAIFWRSSRFKLLHEEAIEFNKFGLRDNVAQICVLQSLSGESSAGSHPPKGTEGRNKVVICNIHVLYNPKRGEIKLGQVRILLERAYATAKLWDDAPVVLCGDYNSTPKSPLYNFISEQKLNLSELPRDKISGQYSAEIRPKRPFTSSFRTHSIGNASQSPTIVDNQRGSSYGVVTDTTHKEEKTTPKLEAREESEGSSANCTSDILENISPDVILNGDSSNDSVGEDSTSFLSELHGPDGADMADGGEVADEADVADADVEPFVETRNSFYDPSGWTPMEIEAATGSSECMTMEHHLKLRSTYTEVEDHSGSRDSNGEPQVTSYHRGFQGTVDYIWRSEGLQTVRVLAPIPKQAMEWTPGYPTKKWGSDHIALVAELAFDKLVDEEKSQSQVH